MKKISNRKVGKFADLENIMYESSTFDICLSFISLFPENNVKINYWKIIETIKGTKGGIKPEATIYLNLNTNHKIWQVFYVKIERMKTVIRTFSEKIRVAEHAYSITTHGSVEEAAAKELEKLYKELNEVRNPK